MARALLLIAISALACCGTGSGVRDVFDGATTDTTTAPEFHATVPQLMAVARRACADYFGEIQSQTEAPGTLDLVAANRRVHIHIFQDPDVKWADHTIVEVTSHVGGEPPANIATGRIDVRAIMNRMRSNEFWRDP